MDTFNITIGTNRAEYSVPSYLFDPRERERFSGGVNLSARSRNQERDQLHRIGTFANDLLHGEMTRFQLDVLQRMVESLKCCYQKPQTVVRESRFLPFVAHDEQGEFLCHAVQCMDKLFVSDEAWTELNKIPESVK